MGSDGGLDGRAWRGSWPPPPPEEPGREAIDDDAYEVLAAIRPRRRNHCRNGIRPCPFASCQFNLLARVDPDGLAHWRQPDRLPWQAEETCALDVAERGGCGDQDLAALLGVRPAAARLVVQRAEHKL